MEKVVQDEKVDPRTVQGRHELSFLSFDDVLADAEKLVACSSVKTLGNWPLSQLLTHLAGAINRSIDGISVKFPFFMRLLGLFMKGRVLKKGLRPGIKLPAEREAIAFPVADSPYESLQSLRRAVDRLRTERMTARHPFFGKLTHEEWVLLHLRHAELHLSFAVPGALP
jgi:hypothetical protein